MNVYQVLFAMGVSTTPRRFVPPGVDLELTEALYDTARGSGEPHIFVSLNGSEKRLFKKARHPGRRPCHRSHRPRTPTPIQLEY